MISYYIEYFWNPLIAEGIEKFVYENIQSFIVPSLPDTQFRKFMWFKGIPKMDRFPTRT